jgi:hypothetical protein
MPGNAGRRTHAGRSLRTRAEAQRLVWRPPKGKLSPASARACAARLMAPGPALEIPRLAPACLDPFRPSASDSGAFTLARNLLLAGIGDPDDWQESNSDPVKFMLRTLTKEATRFDQYAIDSVAHTRLVFGTHPTTGGWRKKENINTNQVFLAVEATHISVVYLRDTFDLLAKINPRLPVTFYRMLLDSLSEWILCYDESAAGPYIEHRIECYEEAKASGEDEEGLEATQTLEAAKGPWLADKYKPFSAGQLRAIVKPIQPDCLGRRILDSTLALLALSRKRKWTRPEWNFWDECFPDGSYTIPFTVLAFHEQDIVCEALQSDEEDWLNGGEESSPAFFTAMNANDISSIRSAFEDFRHFLSMMEALGKHLALLPGVDRLEVED